MSSQKGNISRSRPQKHQNRTVFKNTLHDTSHQTKFLNSIVVSHVCQRCKEVIEWKIKYKKYKTLTQPKKCIKCDQKNVRHAYHVMCIECGRKLKVCTKCCKSKEVVVGIDKQEQIRLDAEMQLLLKTLPERKRRTFIRYINKQSIVDGDEDKQKQKDLLMTKLNSLKLSEGDDDDDDSDFEFYASKDGSNSDVENSDH